MTPKEVPDNVLSQLIELSNGLGDPTADCAILGEGNTSARADDSSFWIKASGSQLRTCGREQFVRVAVDPILAALDAGDLDDARVRQTLADARLDRDVTVMPSVETFLHAVCLELDDVDFIGHTHPTAINAITCSLRFEEALSGRLFPDEIVLCGPAPVMVPYIDPGLPLARTVRDRIRTYVQEFGESPKAMYMQNHGFIALGATAGQVRDITAMAVKAARILAGTYRLGGPNFLAASAVERIHSRPDEHYRQRVLGQRTSGPGGLGKGVEPARDHPA